MKKEFEMKVLPSFQEDEIIFSFRFMKEKNNIGEAVIHTYASDIFQKQESLHTIAFCKEFFILEEYRNVSLKKIMDFLKMIGIRRFNFESNGRIEEKFIV
ncbi:hypothetical protein [Neobacillus sp. D3-1R]|uniref:hypothetical protein n=1 Tax=Neobacillus sp. D3-1R TaxID=3445778 RepID=UPI003FA07AA9